MNDELYDDYKIDVNRIYAGGYSAGAITALLLCLKIVFPLLVFI